ncbi:MAG: TlpA disulfide reductase family protein [Myxococcota bacterium]|nr:TlpA disulfide reductase family protein [Myxococcota bacterium]
MLKLLVSLFLWGCVGPSPTGVLEGEVAPQTKGGALDGSTVVVQSEGGRPALLVFWASWCLPCRAEVPHVNAIVEQYGDRVEVIGINMGEPEAKVRESAQALGMRYPTLVDPQSEISSLWRVRSLPLGVVLDANGRIRFRGNGLPGQPTTLLDGLLVAP